MPRKTRRTMRHLTQNAREIVKLANALDQASRNLIRVAGRVHDLEVESEATRKWFEQYQSRLAQEKARISANPTEDFKS